MGWGCVGQGMVGQGGVAMRWGKGGVRRGEGARGRRGGRDRMERGGDANVGRNRALLLVSLTASSPAESSSDDEQCLCCPNDQKDADPTMVGLGMKATFLISVRTTAITPSADQLTAQKADCGLHRDSATDRTAPMNRPIVQLAKTTGQRDERLVVHQ